MDLHEKTERFKEKFPNLFKEIDLTLTGKLLGSEMADADGEEKIARELKSEHDAISKDFDELLKQF